MPSYSTRSFENVNIFIFYEIHSVEDQNRFAGIAFFYLGIMLTHAEPPATNTGVDGNPAARYSILEVERAIVARRSQPPRSDISN